MLRTTQTRHFVLMPEGHLRLVGKISLCAALRAGHKEGVRVFAVDTNLLIHAASRESPKHDQAQRLLVEWAGSRESWLITWSIAYEFLRVVTHRSAFLHPLSFPTAWSFIEASAGLLPSEFWWKRTATRTSFANLRASIRTSPATACTIFTSRHSCGSTAWWRSARPMWVCTSSSSSASSTRCKEIANAEL